MSLLRLFLIPALCADVQQAHEGRIGALESALSDTAASASMMRQTAMHSLNGSVGRAVDSWR